MDAEACRLESRRYRRRWLRCYTICSTQEAVVWHDAIVYDLGGTLQCARNEHVRSVMTVHGACTSTRVKLYNGRACGACTVLILVC